jgi:hypothetical protein
MRLPALPPLAGEAVRLAADDDCREAAPAGVGAGRGGQGCAEPRARARPLWSRPPPPDDAAELRVKVLHATGASCALPCIQFAYLPARLHAKCQVAWVGGTMPRLNQLEGAPVFGFGRTNTCE